MHKGFLIYSAILGALSVILGAFGAHGLKKIVPAEIIPTFETGVRYQMYHVFALLAVGILFEKFSSKYLIYAGNSFLIGMLLFSGSLYVITLLKATSTVGLKGIGIITPIGGLFLVAGWILLAIGIMQSSK